MTDKVTVYDAFANQIASEVHRGLPEALARKNDASDVAAAITAGLTYVEKRIIEQKFPENRYADHVPVIGSVPKGSETIRNITSTDYGKAKRVSGNTNDVPFVDEKVGEIDYKIERYAAGYNYGLVELAAAGLTGRNLDDRLALRAARAIERSVDLHCATGAYGKDGTTLEFAGLLNQSGVTNTAAGIVLATAAASDPMDVVSWFNDRITAMMTDSFGAFVCSKVLMSFASWKVISSTPVSSVAHNSDTILTMLQKMNPGVKFDTWLHCATAGTGTTDMVVFAAQSSMNYGVHTESVLEVSQPVRDIFTVKIGMISGLSRVELLEPLSLHYYYGV